MSTIEERVADIRRRVAQAADEAGLSAPVTLVAAAKTADAARVREAVRAGVDAVGENRVQEMCEKDAQSAYEGVPLHFIGRLQTNKVNKVVGRAALIHSVDTLGLADAVERCARSLGIVQSVLVQVNIAGEASKGGFAPVALVDALKTMSALGHIRVEGLMCIPPPLRSKDDTQYFVDMRQLHIDISRKRIHNIRMDFLSMGMSDDFEQAVRAGANIIRVGSALFGPRS
ncbi:MAG: YggS family pyridoxal phosphate-dependent enzyme [Oscillospiraceae bacterium]|jgi:pyridoxal phosphate enzyme (YggS family)|nr:YggS family pyridoxal phosphate-dependent enzyme [Oscillospiraceae bacterium]